MSDGKRYPWAEAMAVAQDLQARLVPSCQPGRCVIAGSLRRNKPTVGDVELLYHPKMGTRRIDLLKSEAYSIADEVIENMVRCGILNKRPNKNGVFTWGPKNKLAIHVASGIPVDFFAVPSEVCPCVIVEKKYNGDYERAIMSEPSSLQAHLRCLREALSGAERQSVQQEMQHHTSMERGESEKEGPQSSDHALCHLSNAGSQQPLLEPQKNLFGGVQKKIAPQTDDGAATNIDCQRCVQPDDAQTGLRDGVVSREVRRREQAPLRDGAPSNHGAALGPETGKMGNRTSPQRSEKRQSDRESGNCNVENTHGQRGLSSLSKGVQNKVICPLCLGSGMFIPNWWVSLVIRTGGKETNLQLTNGAIRLGRSLMAYGCGARCSDGSIIAATSEQHVFELCGVPYREPADRP